MLGLLLAFLLHLEFSLCTLVLAEGLVILVDIEADNRRPRVGAGAVIAATDGELGICLLHLGLLLCRATLGQIGDHDALLVADSAGSLLEHVPPMLADEVRTQFCRNGKDNVRELQHRPDAKGVVEGFHLLVTPRIHGILEMGGILTSLRIHHLLVTTVTTRVDEREVELGGLAGPENPLGLATDADVFD